jgi:hypothetical protein
MPYTAPSIDPTWQTTEFVCPLCQQPLALEIPLRGWEIMANNAGFGHLWNSMLPRGLVFGQVRPSACDVPQVEAVPKYIRVEDLHAYGYVPMHSRCFRAGRQAWVGAMQADCTHERATELWRQRCPDCRARV